MRLCAGLHRITPVALAHNRFCPASVEKIGAPVSGLLHTVCACGRGLQSGEASVSGSGTSPMARLLRGLCLPGADHSKAADLPG